MQIKNSTTELQNSIGVENISESIVVIQSIVTTAGSKLISGVFSHKLSATVGLGKNQYGYKPSIFLFYCSTY